ncbi:MAG TPA: DHA2 family efflux MFS transporter permease subunit [Pseudonocardiaceae bacterium]
MSTTSPSHPTTGRPRDVRGRPGLPAVSSVVVLGAFMAILDVTVVTVAINTLSVRFGVSLETIQWATTGYTLALATVIPLTRWAASRFGTKRLYLTAIATFLVGSALAGSAWSIQTLILFRVLQGLGGGMIMPTGMIILTDLAGPQRIGRIMGVLGIPMLLGPILGPLLGGWLVDAASWRWIFFINVPVGLVAIVLGLRILPPGNPKPTERLDWPGLLMLSPGLAALIYGLAQVSRSGGIASVAVLVPALAGLLLIVGFVVRTLRARNPLIDLTLFTNRAFTMSAVAIVLFAVAFFGATFVLPLYYQNVRSDSAGTAGLLMAAQGIGALLSMPLSGMVADRVGPARVARTGIVLIAAGLAAFLVLGANGPYPLLGSVLFVMGAGMGMTMMPMVSAALRALTKADVPTGSTVLNIVQQIGSSIGIATMSTVLGAELASHLPWADARGGLGAAQNVPVALRAKAIPLIANAFDATLVWSLVLLAVAIVPALFLPRGRSESGE